MNQRMDSSRIQIGTYYLQPYARTEGHIQDLAACGIDFVIGMNRDAKTLDLFAKYGIGAIVNGIVPGWFGGTGENAGQMAARNPLEAYLDGAKTFLDHPAIWGIDAGDEPSALDFPHYGRVMALVEREFPNQFAYLNIYPSYGMLASAGQAQATRELGCKSYADYLGSYCRHVQSDYLCFDHYMFTTDHGHLIRDLQTAAQTCKEYGKRLWVVLQVNSLDPQVFLSQEQLCLQAFTALAFGAVCISWACYTAGWWHNHVLDKSGNRTEQYEKLQRVNGRIHNLSREYMPLRWVETVQPDETARLHWGAIRLLHTGAGERVLAGLLEGRTNADEKAVFLCAPVAAQVHFQSAGPVRFLTGAESKLVMPDQNGNCVLFVPACEGGLLLPEG